MSLNSRICNRLPVPTPVLRFFNHSTRNQNAASILSKLNKDIAVSPLMSLFTKLHDAGSEEAHLIFIPEFEAVNGCLLHYYNGSPSLFSS